MGDEAIIHVDQVSRFSHLSECRINSQDTRPYLLIFLVVIHLSSIPPQANDVTVHYTCSQLIMPMDAHVQGSYFL
jgi:hypothetical protein